MWVVVVVLVVVTGGKQSQLLLQPTKVELGLQVGVEFDNTSFLMLIWFPTSSTSDLSLICSYLIEILILISSQLETSE